MKGIRLRRALVVYNKPLYQLHVLEKRDAHFQKLLRKKHSTTKNWRPVYEQHHRTLEGVQRTLELLGIDVDLVFRREFKKIGNYDLVVTVGGDGTFLEVSHFLSHQLLLGVNAAPMDSTGALCFARIDNFLSTLIDLLTGELAPKILPRLKVKIGKKTLDCPVLNEILFAHKNPAGTSRYILQLGNSTEEHKSSGVWVATSTGSTAAIRSAGGRPLPLGRPGMQFAVRELFPEKRKRLKMRQGVLGRGKKLIFYSKMRMGAIFLDGNRIEIPIRYGEKVEISSDGRPLRAVL